ncbi:MAG: ribonuclease III [Clostridia bacterium]|nr:ribonuclease III [Clostridia bacterium]
MKADEFIFLRNLKYENPDQMSAPALAYIGDAVYDLFIRGKLIAEGIRNTGRLHKTAVSFVKAAGQKKAYGMILDRLTEKEKQVAHRGRNSNMGSIPKNADPSDYSMATAFETLLGYLYLKNEMERLMELMEAASIKEND